MVVSVRVSVGKGDRGIIGEGRIDLLRLIEETGSLRQAAIEMGMSYRNAWGTIKHIEGEMGGPMLESVRGGVRGGRSVLTPLARDLMEEYDDAKRKVEQALAGILMNAWIILVVGDGRGSILALDGRLPRARITADRPVPAAMGDLLNRLGVRGDRIRGPKVTSDMDDGSLNLVFQLEPEVNPVSGWVRRGMLSPSDEQKVALFLPVPAEDQDSSEGLEE